MGKDGEKGNDENSDYDSLGIHHADILNDDESNSLHHDSPGKNISLSLTKWRLSLIINDHDEGKPDLNDENSPNTAPEDSIEDVRGITNHRQAYALLPRVYELYNSGNIEEARNMASAILAKYPITPALKLLLESDLALGEKTFCRALEAYLNHLKLSKKKKRNFPIDSNFLSTIFDTAIDRGFFKPVPFEFIPASQRDLSVLELMIKMTDVKKELHLHAELLTALFLALKKQHSHFNI